MKVSSVKDQAQFPAAISEDAEERHGIRTAGESDGETHPRLQEGGVERKSGQ